MHDSDPVNYRSISNLNTITKILERLFLHRILLHVSSSSDYNPLQSAYRRGHCVGHVSGIRHDRPPLTATTTTNYVRYRRSCGEFYSIVHSRPSLVRQIGVGPICGIDIGHRCTAGLFPDPLLWPPPLHSMLQLW